MYNQHIIFKTQVLTSPGIYGEIISDFVQCSM